MLHSESLNEMCSEPFLLKTEKLVENSALFIHN